MKTANSRRYFLRNSLLVSTSLAFFPTMSLGTNGERKEFLNNDFSATDDLRNGPFWNPYLTIKGRVYDSTGKNPLKNQIINICHSGPTKSAHKYKAQFKTDNEGYYRFLTDFPLSEKGKAPRIYFQIPIENGSAETELIINKQGAHFTGQHWEKNHQLNDELFPKKSTYLNNTTIIFNFTNNL